MINNLPFEWFILALRVLFIVLLYFFLFQVVRVVLRELQGANSRSTDDKAIDPAGHLVVVQPGSSVLKARERLDLDPVTVIGRHPRATIRLDNGFVSSEHAQVSWNGGRWWLTDLNSTNGTMLNGRSVSSPTEIRYGDVIEIGDIQLQLAP
ncbi:FHA domain-containing protein [Nitrolancea hollandica]|uniref:FHA domain containing protein n=1 Tax=Nitrolancea hollandica Lb TaxID=1129897 RepID=I4EN62_9BACT|nr:FHA domain-containing protein [Nitrolancea hollandica]CCF86125.1 FHA domain containing protein [Nitrolancea hollandica Lb]